MSENTIDLSGLKRDIQKLLKRDEELLDCSYYSASDRVVIVFKSPTIKRDYLVKQLLAIVEKAVFQGINKELRLCAKIPNGAGVITATIPMPPVYDPEHKMGTEGQLRAIATALSIVERLR